MTDFMIRWRALAIVAAILLYACLLQGVRPIYSPDEGRYTNVALAMLADGDWIHPMLHHEVAHWSKPPLTYWGLAASFTAFGQNEFAARLPGALAFGLTVLLLFDLGRRFVPVRPWLVPLVYVSTLLPQIAANLVSTDSLLGLFEVAQVVAFVRLWWAPPGQQRYAPLWLGVAAGLAFMTKGPPGLLALLACLVFAGWSEGFRGLRRVLRWGMLVLFLLIGCSWYALVAIQDPEVMRYFLVEEVVNRIASDKMHRNAEWYGAFKIYLPTLLVGSLPWLPVLLHSLWQHRRDAVARLRVSPEARFLTCWFLVPLVIFWLARSRLPLYLLPLFAPLSILVARRLSHGFLRTTTQRILLGIWLAMLVVARSVSPDPASDDRRLAQEISAATKRTPQEIAFVTTTPRFGLRFYLGSEIERIDLADIHPQAQSQTLVSELTEHEGCRLLITDRRRIDDLEAALARFAVSFQRLNDVQEYSLIAQHTSDCVWAP